MAAPPKKTPATTGPIAVPSRMIVVTVATIATGEQTGNPVITQARPDLVEVGIPAGCVNEVYAARMETAFRSPPLEELGVGVRERDPQRRRCIVQGGDKGLAKLEVALAKQQETREPIGEILTGLGGHPTLQIAPIDET